jgi:hypothetical protein
MSFLERCDALWVMRFSVEEFQKLRPHQRVSFFPGMTELCLKNKLHDNLFKMKIRYGQEFSFWPNGYWLPRDWDQWVKYYESNSDRSHIPFILKPPRLNRGEGIRCVTHYTQVDINSEFIQKDQPLAQEYILNPILLGGYKITFRIYVAVTSFAPLRIYVFPNGLTRICSERYTTDSESFNNRYIHLTNFDINKHNPGGFIKEVSDDIQHEGLRCDMKYIFERLRKEGKDVDKLWRDIKDIIVKTFLSCERKMGRVVTKCVKYRSNAFELLGFDVLVDINMKPWLLEVNHAPNLEPHTTIETRVKSAMVRDLLLLVDVIQQHARELQQQTKQKSERLKILLATEEVLRRHPYRDYLKKLTQRDIWMIVDTELEFERRGEWERLFPNPDSEKYFPFLEAGTARSNHLIVEFLKLDIHSDELFSSGID